VKRARLLALCGLLAWYCLALALFATSAGAVYGPPSGGLGGAEIVSVDRASDEQADAPTTDAAVSADGRYVVFETKATNFYENDGVPGGDPEPSGACREGGIFRYDRDTGELALVADGTEVALNAKGECEPSHVLVRGAENPSISAEGRYIAFSTAQQLVPQDTNENVDVYVRDMDVPLTADRKGSGAYKLVSAQNGSEEPVTYDDSIFSEPVPGGAPGSEVWPNTSISANGRYVVFRTEVVHSSLPGGSTPTTPPGQLFVRDTLENTTTLVTRTAVGSKSEECDAGGISGGEPACGANGPATISADGSTVAWVGSHAPSQTVFLRGEDLDETTPYYLWQRWQEPGVPTRRITGIADPEDPECAGGSVTGDPTATGPCYGPLTFPEASLAGISSQAPGLSANGNTVAFLAGSALRPNYLKPDSLDVFLTSMAPGVTRKEGTRELTLAVNGSQGDGNASITSLALSSDGSHIAFVSQRNAFVLSAPDPIGKFSAEPQYNELDVIDLATNTLERAVLGLEGTEPNGSTLANPTLAENGSTLAFVSQASNLIFGDANGFSDAFTASLQTPGGTAAPPAGVNAGAGGFSLSAVTSPELGVSVKRAKDGGVILLVETPGPGQLAAQARGSIPKAAPAKKASKGAPRGHKADVALASKAKSRPTKVSPKKQSPVILLASATATARSEGTTTLTLHLSAKYVADLRRAGKLGANVTVDFTPPAPAEALSDEVAVTFVPATVAKKAAGKGKAKKG
jgi:Tol biopolymer transport system component